MGITFTDRRAWDLYVWITNHHHEAAIELVKQRPWDIEWLAIEMRKLAKKAPRSPVKLRGVKFDEIAKTYVDFAYAHALVY